MSLFFKYNIFIQGLLSLLLISVSVKGQDGVQEKIAASQAGASPLVYTTSDKDIPFIVVSDYRNDKECIVRSGLPNFFTKMKEGKDLTVAFIGGSITQGDYCYRLQVSKYLEDHYPGVTFKWINAGVSGTGTDLGAFRLQEQVLDFNPDLIFIEFAVNGAYLDGMEGIVRQIIKKDARTDICLLYTIITGQTALYQKNDMPLVIKGLEKIAEHYQIPSVHLGMEAAQMETDKLLLWKGTKDEAGGRILFSGDGIHPITSGGNLYAAALARAIIKIESDKTTAISHSLPTPLISADWENARMYAPQQIARFDSYWENIKTKEEPQLKKFNEWFDTVMTSGKKGASFSFRFEGDMFGLFDIGGPEVGQVEVVADNRILRFKPGNIPGARYLDSGIEAGNYTINRFNAYCNSRYRGQYDVVKLKKGVHYVTIRISFADADKKAILGKDQQGDISQHPEKYGKSVIYLGRILLRGKPLPLDDEKTPTQPQKWEQKIARYETIDAVDKPGKDVVLFVGSSTIENWKSLTNDFPGKNVLNRGVSGTKTIDLFNFKERLIYPYQAKQIFIYEGDNDIGYKWAPEKILSQFQELFFAIRQEKPNAELMFISIKPSPLRVKDRDDIEKTNSLIKAFIDQQPNAGYVDVYTPMLTAEGELYPEHYREDGLHLTSEGYKVWKQVISKFIK